MAQLALQGDAMWQTRLAEGSKTLVLTVWTGKPQLLTVEQASQLTLPQFGNLWQVIRQIDSLMVTRLHRMWRYLTHYSVQVDYPCCTAFACIPNMGGIMIRTRFKTMVLIQPTNNIMYKDGKLDGTVCTPFAQPCCTLCCRSM